jgi:hypothetical protein
MAKLNNFSSPKEILLNGANVVAGNMYVNADTGQVVVPATNMTAAAFATLIGASGIKSIDYPGRVGAFSDTGRPIFDV